MENRKRGSIDVDLKVLENTPLEVMGAALSGLVVWHIDSNFYEGRITYFGEHPDFDPIHEAHKAPKYDMVFDANGKSTFARQ